MPVTDLNKKKEELADLSSLFRKNQRQLSEEEIARNEIGRFVVNEGGQVEGQLHKVLDRMIHDPLTDAEKKQLSGKEDEVVIVASPDTSQLTSGKHSRSLYGMEEEKKDEQDQQEEQELSPLNELSER